MARSYGGIMHADKSGNAALRKGRVSLANTAYLITAVTENRSRYFENFNVACAASRCFEDGKLLRDAKMLAWVLMPDHVHWLIQLGEAGSLDGVVNRLKSSSARHVNKVLGRSGAIWIPAYYDHALREDEDLQAAARYVVANPLRAGLVNKIGDYPFWNAVWV